jgi:hypothetical protein
MMQRFFGNSRERLLVSLLGDEEIDPEELRRLKAAILARSAEDAVAGPTHGDNTAMNGAPKMRAAQEGQR